MSILVWQRMAAKNSWRAYVNDKIVIDIRPLPEFQFELTLEDNSKVIMNSFDRVEADFLG